MATPLTADRMLTAVERVGWKTHQTMNERDAARFWSKVAIPATPDGCMEWTAYQDRNGYGKINMGGRQGRVEFAHRVAYRALAGAIPDELVLDHLCRNRACVRPDHLEAVPQAENVRRAESFHAAKTHCPQGHPYEGDNLIIRIRPNGVNRLCRECRRASQRGKKKVAA